MATEIQGRNIACCECLVEEPIPMYDWEPNQGYLLKFQAFFDSLAATHKDCVRDWADTYISKRGVRVVDKRFRD